MTYFVPGYPSITLSVFDLLNTAKSIKDNIRTSATPVLALSLYEMYKKGYVSLEYISKGSKFFNPMVVFIRKKLDKDFVNKDYDFLVLDYSEEPYLLRAHLTEEGELWLESQKKKYPDLFDEVSSIRKTSLDDYDDILLPTGYEKRGVIKNTIDSDSENWNFVFAEIDTSET